MFHSSSINGILIETPEEFDFETVLRIVNMVTNPGEHLIVTGVDRLKLSCIIETVRIRVCKLKN